MISGAETVARREDAPRRTVRRAHRLVLASSVALAALLCFPALADDGPPLPRDDFGGVGLIEMPSARMAPDGELSAGASFFKNTQHYNLGFQILPWLEASFRYSGLDHFNTDFPVYYDRAFAVKARLFQETDYTPALAIGINDLVGTGVYGGEYIVASKQFGDFDATLGMGWGRLGSADNFRNPLGAISKSFYDRAPFSGEGGTFNFNAYFHGPTAGIFGGVDWRTPLNGLTLIAEYSSDAYTAETVSGNFKPRNQMNFGASYAPLDSVTLGLNWLYGESIGASISFQLDPTRPQYPEKLGAPPPMVQARTQQQQQQALVLMMQQRDAARAGQQASWIQTSVTRAISKNAFVDYLLGDGSNYSDVQIRGRTLMLTMPADATMTRCYAIAQLARSYGADIDIIMLRGGHGTQARRCDVAIIPASMLLTDQATVYDDQGMPLLPPAPTAAPVPVTDNKNAMAAIRADSRKQRIGIQALWLGESEAVVYYNNAHYFSEAEAIGRLTRVLMNDAPPRIEKFRLIAVVNGVPQREFDVLRAPMERDLAQPGSDDFLGGAVAGKAAPMENSVLAVADRRSYPHFSWDIFPQFRQSLFDPDNPFAVQFLASADGTVELLPGVSLNAEIEVSLYDDFNRNRVNNSTLPHVRSDFIKYFEQGRTGIGDLEADYRFRLAPNVFAIAKAGYLESMFAGAGGEVLWRPEGQRWALGVDLYEVWQRDFDRLFGLQNYHVLTGHVSLYYQSPWHDINFALSAGQYLAGDRGLTIQVTRRFSTGVEIGAFVTKTNVSSQQFGEGSFDKGIIIRIPLDWVAPIETQGQFNMDLRPVQRDGGQRLLGDAILYGETQRASEGEMYSHANDFANPGE